MSPIPPGNNQGYEFTNMFFVTSYSLIDTRFSQSVEIFLIAKIIHGRTILGNHDQLVENS